MGGTFIIIFMGMEFHSLHNVGLLVTIFYKLKPIHMNMIIR